MKQPKKNPTKSRQVIIEAASSLFRELGYNGTTMRDIAARVGTLAGSLYSHIKNKEEILLEIVATGLKGFLEIEEKICAMETSAEEKLRYAVIAHMKLVAEHPERMLIVFHQWRFLTEPNLSSAVKLRRRYAQAYTDILKEGIANGEFTSDLIDPKIGVFSILGALNWTVEWYSSDGTYSPEQIGDRMTDTLIYGLRARRDR